MAAEALTHPEEDVLSAFGLGKLPLDQARKVEVHIAECESCCQTLLDLQSDTFAELVRSANADKTICFDQKAQPDDTASHVPNASDHRTGVPSELECHPRYRTVELLGQGGMGRVYRAEHRLMNRMVALKVINRDLLAERSVVDRFRREVQAAAQLSHPNIVTAYDAEEVGDVHVLAMELVDGTDLSEVVKRKGPLPVDVACDVICQAAAGLQHAHDCGMVHRDIKPHNLMVTTNGRVKILDFGLASLSANSETALHMLPAWNVAGTDSSVPAESEGTPPENRLTNVGCTMGTPDFVSPEQADDAHAADARSDIYSLGCTLYFLLAGTPPFAQGSTEEKLDAHRRREPQPIEHLRSDLPARVADSVRRMMAKDPADRFQTPAEVSAALESFVGRSSSLKSAVTRAPSVFSFRRPSTFGRVATTVASAALLVPAAVLLAGYFLPDDPPKSPDSTANAKSDAESSRQSPPVRKPIPDINASTEYAEVFHSPSSDVTPEVFRSIFQLEIVTRRAEENRQVIYADGCVVSADGLIATVVAEPGTGPDTLEIEAATLMTLDGRSVAARILSYDPGYGVAIVRVEDLDLPHLRLSTNKLVANQRLSWHVVYRDGRRTYLYSRPVRIHRSAHTVGATEDLCEIVDTGTSALSAERSGSALVAHDGSLVAIMGRQEHWNVTPRNEHPRKKLAWAVPAHVIASLTLSATQN